MYSLLIPHSLVISFLIHFFHAFLSYLYQWSPNVWNRWTTDNISQTTRCPHNQTLDRKHYKGLWRLLCSINYSPCSWISVLEWLVHTFMVWIHACSFRSFSLSLLVLSHLPELRTHLLLSFILCSSQCLETQNSSVSHLCLSGQVVALLHHCAGRTHPLLQWVGNHRY